MRFMIAAALAATTLTAVPAMAQNNPNREYREEVRDAQRDRQRDLRNADSRQDVRRAQNEYRRDVRDAQQDRRQDVRDWRQYRNYDYNRLPPGNQRYYADRFYRAGNDYRPRRLTRNDRIYRGGNGQYYCRRSDGTTGLIIGGLTGGALGTLLTNGNSQILGALVGGGAGAVLGRSIDRGNVTCR